MDEKNIESDIANKTDMEKNVSELKDSDNNPAVEDRKSDNAIIESETDEDFSDEDDFDVAGGDGEYTKDFGNVTDEDYDTENDKDSMRAFYVISITALCIFVLLTGLIVTNRLFPDLISFSGDGESGTQLDSVEPSVENSDTEDDLNDGKNLQDTVVPENDNIDDVISQNNSTSNVDGQTALSVTEIYKSCVNSVVGITTEGTTKNIFGQVSKNASTGTGIIYSADGYILTNYHVVESGTTHTVTLYNGESYKAELVGYEAANDIALLKIDAKKLTNAYIGDSDDISVGEDVVVIGNPLGELTYTLTRGVVSALNRVIHTDATPMNMFQIDAAVNSGNSGGPAFDSRGCVIGIVTAKYSADTIEGIGFCIPINDAVSIAEELKTYGYVRGNAGLELCAGDGYLTYGNSWVTSYAIYGAKVTFVKKDGASGLSGIVAGDMIVEVNGTMVASVAELQTVLRTFSVGDKIEVVAYHSSNGTSYDKKTYIVTLGERSPLNVPKDYSADKYGSIV